MAGSLYRTHSPTAVPKKKKKKKIKHEEKGQLRNEKLKIEFLSLSDLLGSIFHGTQLRGNDRVLMSITGRWHLDSHLCTESCNSHAREQESLNKATSHQSEQWGSQQAAPHGDRTGSTPQHTVVEQIPEGGREATEGAPNTT